MFDFVRKHTKIMQFILFLLILPSFVLFGLDGYTRFRDQGDAVAFVDGQKILQGEWDTAHKSEVERIRQNMPNLDAKLLDSPEAKYATLERLVREKVLNTAVQKQHLSITDAKLLREMQQDQNLMSFVKDGKFDMDSFKQRVGAKGMSPEMFVAQVRQDMAARQVLLGVAESSLQTKASGDQALAALLERREVNVLPFAAMNFASKVSATPEQLDAFYKENPQLFQAPETANVEYLTLDLDAARKGVTLKPEDVKAYYDQNAARMAAQEERRASHILLTASKSASANERAAAKTKLEGILTQAKAAPDGFAELAKKHSQDPGSGPNGGDLDFFTREAMVKPFSDAAFTMQKGEISPIIETEFGFHIIRLTDIKVAKQKSFEEAKAQIEADLTKQQAQRKFAELAESFTNLVYEQPESLKPAADRLGLQIKTLANVQRKPGPDSTGAFANAKLLNALFAPDTIEKKRNTEAVEINKTQLVSARIVQHTPARTLPFADVKDKVQQAWVAKASVEAAEKEGVAKLAEIQTKPAEAKLPDAQIVSRDKSANLPPAVVEAVLRADPAKLPITTGIKLPNLGYAIVRVNKVLPPEITGEQVIKVAEQGRTQIAKLWGQAEATAYYNALKQSLKTEIKIAKPVPKKDDVAL